MYCGDQTLIGTGSDDVAISTLKCRRWTCEDCFPKRAAELRRLAADGEPETLITLTVKPKAFSSPDAAAKALVKAWRNIRQRAIREGYADRVPFLAVFELTKRGWPHLHILARLPFLPQQWLSARCQQYLRSPIVDIRKVYNRRHASRYIAKYVSKEPIRLHGCKRYWRSQDWSLQDEASKPVHDSGRTWWRSDADKQWWIGYLQICDWVHRHDDGDRAIMAPTLGARWPWRSRPPPTMEELVRCAR